MASLEARLRDRPDLTAWQVCREMLVDVSARTGEALQVDVDSTSGTRLLAAAAQISGRSRRGGGSGHLGPDEGVVGAGGEDGMGLMTSASRQSLAPSQSGRLSRSSSRLARASRPPSAALSNASFSSRASSPAGPGETALTALLEGIWHPRTPYNSRVVISASAMQHRERRRLTTARSLRVRAASRGHSAASRTSTSEMSPRVKRTTHEAPGTLRGILMHGEKGSARGGERLVRPGTRFSEYPVDEDELSDWELSDEEDRGAHGRPATGQTLRATPRAPTRRPATSGARLARRDVMAKATQIPADVQRKWDFEAARRELDLATRNVSLSSEVSRRALIMAKRESAIPSLPHWGKVYEAADSDERVRESMARIRRLDRAAKRAERRRARSPPPQPPGFGADGRLQLRSDGKAAPRSPRVGGYARVHQPGTLGVSIRRSPFPDTAASLSVGALAMHERVGE